MSRPARAEPPNVWTGGGAGILIRRGAALCAGFALLLVGCIALGRLGAVGVPLPDWMTARPDCDGRCPLGLRPGWTDIDEAAALLAAHPWAKHVHYTRGLELDTGYLRWEWTGAQPAGIDAGQPGSVYIQRGFVQWVDIATTPPFATFWQMLGPPDSGRVHPLSGMPARVFQVVTYDRALLALRTEILCPADRARYWRAPVVVRFNSPDESFVMRRADAEPWAGVSLGACA